MGIWLVFNIDCLLQITAFILCIKNLITVFGLVDDKVVLIKKGTPFI